MFGELCPNSIPCHASATGGGGLYSILAPAKVNLVLEVNGLRADGYHEIATIFQSIALFDVVTVIPGAAGSPAQGIQLVVRKGKAPAGRDNLAWRAAALLAEKIGLEKFDVTIILDKEVPEAGGLGGGSSDAAAVLRLLARLWRVESAGIIQETALALGADVPFFLHGGAALGRNRGDELEQLDLPVMWLVLANPGRQCSTKEVYKKYEDCRQKLNTTPVSAAPISAAPAGAATAGTAPSALGRHSRRFLQAVEEGGVAAAGRFLYNDLAEPARQMVPEIDNLITALKDAGALGVEVSGSGATVFAIAGGPKEAEHLAAQVAGIAAWTWWGPSINRINSILF